MAFTRMSRQPSPYNRFAFHGIRAVQVCSSAFVTGILAWFVACLREDHYYVPWTFITLLSVSASTVLAAFITSGFYHTRVITPRMSVFINAGLTAIWGAGFACMTYYLSDLLVHSCSVKNWDHDMGVLVCRFYKGLYFVVVVALISTVASLVLDVLTIRRGASRGIYNPMDDSKRAFDAEMGDPSAGDPSAGAGDHGHGFRDASMDYTTVRPYNATKMMNMHPGHTAHTAYKSVGGYSDAGA